MVLVIIFIKTPITQPKIVQIQKFWCLNPSTIICLSCENILSIKKCHQKLLSREETFKTCKIRLQFSIENAKKCNFSKMAQPNLLVSIALSSWGCLLNGGISPPDAHFFKNFQCSEDGLFSVWYCRTICVCCATRLQQYNDNLTDGLLSSCFNQNSQLKKCLMCWEKYFNSRLCVGRNAGL